MSDDKRNVMSLELIVHSAESAAWIAQGGQRWRGQHPALSRETARLMLPRGACKECVAWRRLTFGARAYVPSSVECRPRALDLQFELWLCSRCGLRR